MSVVPPIVKIGVVALFTKKKIFEMVMRLLRELSAVPLMVCVPVILVDVLSIGFVMPCRWTAPGIVKFSVYDPGGIRIT